MVVTYLNNISINNIMDPILRYEIDKIKKISTSNDELSKKMGRPIKIIKYSQLKKYRDIDELLGPYGECIILYETQPNVGHWVCCFRRTDDKNIISFFDSLGLMPDDQFHSICVKFRKESGIYYPYLTYLLSKTKSKVEWNEYQLQEHGSHVATCGRWCILRLRMKHLDPNKFYELFKDDNNIDSDDLVILSY